MHSSARLCVALLFLCGLSLVSGQTNRLPIPTHSIYVFTEDEQQSTGSVLTNGSPSSRIMATDPDGDDITYVIPSNSINSQLFNMNATTGELSFAQVLDRDIAYSDPLELLVEIDDGQFHGIGVSNPTVEVRVVLVDINDNPPTFEDDTVSRTVREDADINSAVYDVDATDIDAGANGQISYFLEEVNGERCFNVSSKGPACELFDVGLITGIVTLTSSLDYDTLTMGRREHMVDVLAQDSGSPQRTATLELTVSVSDANDLDPVFMQGEYQFEVHENLTFGASVGQVEAYDQDEGVNDRIFYSILSGNEEINGTETFAINQTTGVIYVNTVILDRETHRVYTLDVQASEESVSTNTDEVMVIIIVLDINDNSPRFENSSYSATIPETTPTGSTVVMVTALDPDQGVHAEFEFRLENVTPNWMDPLPFMLEHDVNSGIGSLVVSSSLDFERVQTFIILVFATETINNGSQSGVTTVTVNLLNDNDHTPVFNQSVYEGMVPENGSPGETAVIVSATDEDVAPLGGVRYAIAGGLGADDFVISENGGVVRTNSTLDHERISVYNLTVTATDLDPNNTTRRTGEATLIVRVVNLNDNPPNITTGTRFFDEEQSVGAVIDVINVADPDGTLDPLTLEILEGNEDGLFEIKGFNLTVTRVLDFDDPATNRTYPLTFEVNDTRHTDMATVLFQLEDINDNDPVFDSSSLTLMVLEHQGSGAIVGRVIAVDSDSGSFGQVTYNISGNGADNFMINASTGYVVTTVDFDREDQPIPFELQVIATDQDSNPSNRGQTLARLIINIGDVNDNSPVFDDESYSFTILENTDVLNSTVFRVSASDQDIGSNGQIVYSIQSGNVGDVFIIDPTSGVLARNPLRYLNREVHERYTLTIVASDNGTVPNNTTVSVIIVLLDENDITPTFDLPQFEAEISEDSGAGTFVRNVTAIDDDADDNGLVTYSIVSVTGPSADLDAPSGSFVVNEQTGEIRTTGVFDREAFEGPYTVIVMAEDGGSPSSLSSTTILIVFITDANDEVPTFLQDEYIAIVPENLSLGELVAIVTAIDADMPGSNNSVVTYSIINSGSGFVINSTGAITTTTPLDYSMVQSYTLTVQAVDSGASPRSSSVIVRVNVMDVNNMAPVFSQSSYTIRLSEDTPVNTRLQGISASDSDTPPNAVIMYSASITSPLRIDPSTGELILTSPLDFEQTQIYQFNVTATNEGGGVVFSVTSDVRVEVTDINDNPPVFRSLDSSVSVPEGNYSSNPLVLQLLTLFAEDADSGALGNVTYDLLLSEDRALWEVRTTANGRGQLVAIGNLDREAVSNYLVRVVARDGGDPAAMATSLVRVTVTDRNDNAPELNRAVYNASVFENSMSGEIIARVLATDIDAANNGDVILELSNDADFAIDTETGEVYTRREFNYEQEMSFTVDIIATDNATIDDSLSTTALLLVTIIDVNDNTPIFMNPPNTPSMVSEGNSVGREVLTLTATDNDSGSNGEVEYSLTGDQGDFAIDSDGVITIAMPLDRETTPTYMLTVIARDRGRPQMSAEFVTSFLLIDVNDQAPVFQQSSYSFVRAEVATTITVGTLVAIDADSLPNQNTAMEIVEGDSSLFQIIVLDIGGGVFFGNITNTRALDYENTSIHNLRVRAYDTNDTQLESFTLVQIILTDTNDNPPVFAAPSYTFSVNSDAVSGSPVGTVVATDDDGGVSGRVSYDFDANVDPSISSLFSIRSTDGLITVIGPLLTSSYNFSVLARDMGTPAMTSQPVSVSVTVFEVSVDPPVFDREYYQGSVAENQAVGTSVTQVSATVSGGGSVEYSIADGDPNNRFSLNSILGELRTLQNLDREEQASYILTVAASSGTPPQTAYSQVLVMITDTNDLSPMILEPLVFTVPEGAFVGSPVGSLRASDGDAGDNAVVTFSSSASGPFTIQPDGDILVADSSALDYETTPTYMVTVVATDGASQEPQSSTTTTITILLTNVNDNIPEFDEDIYMADVEENSPAGVSVFTVGAIDDDGDSLTYSIHSGDTGGYFQINVLTGLIETTNSSLDREMDQQITLVVRAEDPLGLRSDVSVVITVLDVNDNAPDCGAPLTINEVSEANLNRVRLGLLTVSDRDAGLNGQVGFSIFSGDFDNIFSVNADGELFAAPGLDYETTPIYMLSVAAVDKSADLRDRQTSLCTVMVNLVDANDNSPVFDSLLYEASAVENATVGTPVITVRATDADSSINSDLFYTFQSTTREFSVNSSTGEVTVAGSLDAETNPLYTLVLEARDRGRVPRTGLTTLVVTVGDIDDNAPSFDSSFFSISIREDLGMNSDVLSLLATDPDSSTVTYFIQDGNNELYFRINPSTGLLQTARPLDRETIAEFIITVAARDEAGNTGITIVDVVVTDINDEAPIFTQSAYYARVPENSPSGTQVLPTFNGSTVRIEAVDADQPNTLNSRVLYSLTGDNAQLFSINPNTGIITVATGANLDAEDQSPVIVTVVASDSVLPPNTNTVQLEVVLTDVNDESPEFTQPFGYAIAVSEGAEQFSVITSRIRAVDRDGGLGGVIRYSIIGAVPLEARDWFEINSMNGDISLVQSLDREANDIVSLIVLATDQGEPALISQVSVQFTISDVNDNAPQFTDLQYDAVVPESLAVGARVVRVVARDADVGSNGEVAYFMAPAVDEFTVNPNTGEITTTAPLDHETQDRYTLNILAQDSGSPPLNSSVQVFVFVQDINDEPPTFDLSIYSVDVCSDAPQDTQLVQPVAVDKDSGANAQLRYSLEGDNWALFDINPSTGLVTLSRGVDFNDLVTGSFSLRVLASDGGQSALTGSAELRLRVLNCTTRGFFFLQPYNYYQINELVDTFVGGVRTLSVPIVPTTTQGVEFYPDFPQNPFTVETGSVLLSLKNSTALSELGVGQGMGLDRETRGVYTVILRATNNGLDSFASVTVRVLDVNDNSPQFQRDQYFFNIPENISDPVIVGNVTASDRDEGVNSVVNYTIESASISPHPFSIEPLSGVITTTAVLDRELTDSYTLIIVASDIGDQEVTATVEVTVEDRNDETPTFMMDVFNVNVTENVAVGTIVATLTAQDRDLGSSGLLQYSIVGGDVGIFSLDAETGALHTSSVLDYETVTGYSLMVQAVDNGFPVRTGQALVNIMVEDFNDSPPMFFGVPAAGVRVLENVTINTLIHTFNVTDCDTGLNGREGTRFTIIAGNEEGLFSLNPVNGTLVIMEMLDREITANFLLSIQAMDSAGPNSLSSVTQLLITVDDINDNPPRFSNDMILRTVSENADISSTLFTFQASDPDLGANGDIQYSLMDSFGVFRVDQSTGAISLLSTLDRETVSSYNLTVIARDRGQPIPQQSSLSIALDVRDVNDNPPAFLNITSSTTATIIEGTVFGTQVFEVEAIDPDQGMNGEVSFMIQDISDNQPFEISSTGGVIYVAQDIDFEEQNVYTLIIIAMDNGSPRQLSSLATLTINILDNNDNPPQFTLGVYEGSQEEGIGIGSSVTTVLATDDDQPGSPNSQVEYSLVGGAMEYFSIDSTSGLISNRIILDRENQSEFTLRVLANNSRSHTPLTAFADVIVTVTDRNDERPIFDQSEYSTSLSELMTTGLAINITVSATDNDAPGTPNSALVYSLARQSNNPFSIDPNSGEVILQNSLDFELTQSYSLTVVVEDKGTPTLSSEARLLIMVQDENDVPPSFDQPSYSAEVSEGVDTFPYLILSLGYIDRDRQPLFNQSSFSISGVNPRNSFDLFEVSPSGLLSVTRSVDFEQVQEYSLDITVENVVPGQGPLCEGSSQCVFAQTTTVQVFVRDENDNAPVFTRQTYTGEVSSTAATGTSVLEVEAEDGDAGAFTGSVLYSLETSVGLPFRIQETTGTVLTRGLLSDIPSGSVFDFFVIAEDNGGVSPTNRVQTSVIIVVLDDFDRIAFDFRSDLGCVISNEQFFADYLSNVTGYTIVIESYSQYATDTSSLFIIHALDPNGAIVDFALFTDRIQSREAEIFQMFGRCNLTRIISFAEAEEPYEYPPLVDTQTIVILVLCLLLIIGSAVLLVMALTQRYLALNDARHKLLADVFYGGSPGSGSVVESGDNYQLEENIELTGKNVNRQNPMFLDPYDNWASVDTSGVESVEGASTLNRDNPLYESQEIRMEMFADVQSEDDDADDAELLAQAIAEDESDDDDDNIVTPI